MVSERRKGERVTFERGIAAPYDGHRRHLAARLLMEDVSETGAKLTVEGSVEGLHLKEFFLLLSSTGLAYRAIELAWSTATRSEVQFSLKRRQEEKRRHRRARAEA